VTSPLRALTAAATAALLLTLAACASGPSTTTAEPTTSAAASAPAADGECDGVTVVVDASAFGDADETSLSECVQTDGPIAAVDAFTQVDVETEGTVEYGDQVVCRVNGVPAEDVALTSAEGAEHFETCESMPAAFAYWSLWVKPEAGEWGYAQEGLSTLELQPGESVALLFTLNGEPAAPSL